MLKKSITGVSFYKQKLFQSFYFLYLFVKCTNFWVKTLLSKVYTKVF